MTAPAYSIVQYPHHNPGASSPLTLTLIVVPNTSPEQVVANVKANTEQPLEWLKFQSETPKPAIIVGGGPSAADHLDTIRHLRLEGGVIFATNGASRWLRKHNIMPDWQVIADPQARTAQLVDPQARGHLFSSAVDPTTLARVATPILWHRYMEGVENLFPEHRQREEYALIGGTSAGTHAMCLTYAMGHREVHCFGFDSSHRAGKGHAYRQPMNDSIETCQVSWAGITYQASIAMKAQAESFMILARNIEEAGVTLKVHGDGLLPAMWNTPTEHLCERDKYRLMWAFDVYRQVSPGEDLTPFILKLLQPDGLTVDFGCGTGRASLAMAKQGIDVLQVDFADNCRDHESIVLPFLEWDLTKPLPVTAPYGLCCDVMEHIPPDDVNAVARNIMQAARKVFFSIATVPDACGALIHEDLHLTVRPHEWWLEMLQQYGIATYAMKRADDSLFVLVAPPSTTPTGD